MHRKTKKTDAPAKPPVRISKLYIYRFWEKDKNKQYVPRRSDVYNDYKLDFVKSYEYLHDHYLKKDGDSPPLMKYAELGAYLDFMLMLKRGENWTLEEFAEARQLDPHTLVAYLDNLENINLLHREQSRDGSGHRIIIVIHTPLPPDELKLQRAELLRRRKEQDIQARRLKAGRNKRDWLPKAFSWKKLLKAFDNRDGQAEKFENIVADTYHQHKNHKDFTDADFLNAVERACRHYQVIFDDGRHHQLALEIKEWLERL